MRTTPSPLPAGRAVPRSPVLLVFLCVLPAACAGANWKRSKVFASYQVPQQINVDISARTAGDLSFPIALMREHIAEELNDRNIAVTFTFDRPPPGSAQVGIVEWEPGLRLLRFLLPLFGLGQGTIDVFVRAPSRNGQPGLSGDVHGWVNWGALGGNSAISAAHAGKAIGRFIATGKAD
jgi:hypothetical protein